MAFFYQNTAKIKVQNFRHVPQPRPFSFIPILRPPACRCVNGSSLLLTHIALPSNHLIESRADLTHSLRRGQPYFFISDTTPPGPRLAASPGPGYPDNRLSAQLVQGLEKPLPRVNFRQNGAGDLTQTRTFPSFPCKSLLPNFEPKATKSGYNDTLVISENIPLPKLETRASDPMEISEVASPAMRLC